MVDPRRYSPQTIAVLGGLAAQPTRWRYGYELGQQVGLKSGSLYPILMRLADQGLLESIWETDPPHGRPPRHLYRLSTSGLAVATDLAAAPGPTRRQRPQPAGAS
jgi:PadR family transcriptional regulator, regulatory protein PadR